MKEKQTYTSPQCETHKLRLKGVIAASVDVDLTTTFTAPFEEEQEWGAIL